VTAHHRVAGIRRRVAITGCGAITPIGNDVPTTWTSLVAGRSGIGPLTRFDASTFPVRIAAEVKDFDVELRIPDRRERRYLSRAGAFAMAASEEALHDAFGQPLAALAIHRAEERGVAIGSSIGRPTPEEIAGFLEEERGSYAPRPRPRPPVEVVRRDQNVPGAIAARRWNCEGPMLNVSTACAGAAHAIGEAYRRIQEGDATLMIAGGADSLTTWMDMLGFSLLGALAAGYEDNPHQASRPFDGRRSGFVIGEGAAIFVLEDWDVAIGRGATIHAELCGYGSSLNGYRITDSPPDGAGAIRAMEAAIVEAGLPAPAIDYVAAHGTGTLGNDASETVALKAVFGPAARRIPLSSPKSMAGHLTSAAGGLNLIAALGALREQIVPPTINLDHPDPKLDLDYVPHRARPARVRAALVNAFAFGGTNAALVVRHREDAR
jgi:3-oxoacyl-[acyl-carrier-protein] synthase II